MKKTCLYFLITGLMIAGSIKGLKAAEIDNGTDEDGRVIWPETLANRCDLSSTDLSLPKECYEKIVSDYKLGRTPSGENYDRQINQILHERMKDTLSLVLKRLADTGTHHDEVSALAGKYPEDLLSKSMEASLSEETEEGDIREALEQINKLNLKNFEVMGTVVDNASLFRSIESYEKLFNQIIPEMAQTIFAEDALKEDLRKDRMRP